MDVDDDEGAQSSDEPWARARAERLLRDTTIVRSLPGIQVQGGGAACEFCDYYQWEPGLYWLDDKPFCCLSHRQIYQDIMHERARAERH